MKAIKATIAVPPERVMYALHAALKRSGSSRFWCKVVAAARPRKPRKRYVVMKGINRHVDCLMNGGTLLVRDTMAEDLSGRRGQLRLTWDKVGRGVRLLARQYPVHFAALLTGKDDGRTGDVLVECALLGGAVYAIYDLDI